MRSHFCCYGAKKSFFFCLHLEGVMGIKAEKESQNKQPIFIEDFVFKCKCGELVGCHEKERHRQEKHSGEYNIFVSLKICSSRGDGEEHWTHSLTVSQLNPERVLVLEDED